MRRGHSGSSLLRLIPCLLLAVAPAPVLLVSAGAGEDPPPAEATAKPRLSPHDFKVFGGDQPIAGSYRFAHPVTGETQEVALVPAPEGEQGLVGLLGEGGLRILTLVPKRAGVGWEGEMRGLLTSCGQERVPISDLLPLGDKVILRLDARPPEIPCPFLEDRSRARLLVAPATKPVRLRDSRDIVSERTREQIGLAGQPGGVSTPLVAGAVSVEGGTELKFVGRTRSLDGSVWIEVEALVSPAPGMEAPRGFVRSDELLVDASITLERIPPASGS